MFDASDAMRTMEMPPAAMLRPHVSKLQQALDKESCPAAEKACQSLAAAVAKFYDVPVPPVSVLGVRPHRVAEGVCVYEKFGDYDLRSMSIRVWMRTAIQQRITSFGTLLSTLCHECCHHLDRVSFGFTDTPHTRGFYERAGLLYHRAAGTPVRQLIWVKVGSVYRIDWGRTMRST